MFPYRGAPSEACFFRSHALSGRLLGIGCSRIPHSVSSEKLASRTFIHLSCARRSFSRPEDIKWVEYHRVIVLILCR
jgi:hypothetical protein